jgi:hypothetical protein
MAVSLPLKPDDLLLLGNDGAEAFTRAMTAAIRVQPVQPVKRA